MKLIVGLGNPGGKYARNRHNVGFMALDAILSAHGFGPPRARFQGETFEGRFGGEKVLALKPTTYMNESGRAVGAAMRFFKLTPADVIVLHDEIDLAPAKLRVKVGGGHAGNNGIRSIAQHIGAEFTRVRIGVGHPGDKGRVHGHVLSDFAKADDTWLRPLLDAIADHVGLLVTDDHPGFLNRVAATIKPNTPKPAPKAAGAKSEAGN